MDNTTQNAAPRMPGAISDTELAARLDHHTMNAGQIEQSNNVRNAAKLFASIIVGAAPAGRESSLAITHVEEALMWANKAIARGAA